MLPSGMYAACVQTLQLLAQRITSGVLELHFADEEGDPYAVELAARLGGYVVGKDSDFVILNADGYLGYVPLDLMVWNSLTAQENGADEVADDGFQTVINSKSKKAFKRPTSSARGILPPEDTDGLELTVVIYSPNSLSQHLQLPTSLLPLLGALVGNDFTGSKDSSSVTTGQNTNLQWLFFERSLTLAQRITRAAGVLRGILDAALAPGQKQRQKHAVHSVMGLIEKAVTALTVRAADSISSGERAKILERIVEATLQYAIPRYEGELAGAEGLWPSNVCALHDPDDCPLLAYIAQPVSDELFARAPAEAEELQARRDKIRALYVSAYRAGRLDPHTLDVVHSGTFWYRQFLENPDLEGVARSIARPIQLWAYALVEESLGLLARQEPLVEEDGTEGATEDGNENGDEDDDELVDVIEESDDDEVDPLAPLRGALKQLNTSDSDSPDLSSSDSPTPLSLQPSVNKTKPKTVEEYLRRGTRLAAEEVPVPSITELISNVPGNADASQIPIQLSPPSERLSFFFRALRSDNTLLPSIPPEQRMAAVVLRWVVSQLHLRAQEREGDKLRDRERWTKQEARAFLASFSFGRPRALEDAEDLSEPVPIVDRNVQLVAQVSITMDCVDRLSQLLLLQEEVQNPVLRFSGSRFHAYLTGSRPIPSDNVPDRLWHAAVDGLDHAFTEPLGKKKKEKRKEVKAVPPAAGRRGQKSVAVGSKFGLLASLGS